MADDDDLVIEAREAWEMTAPGYVKQDVKVLDGELRDWIERGMTPKMFREALEMAFANRDVTKRNALAYAFGIVRRRMGPK